MSARVEWQGINVLRGVAGLCMVADHVYVERPAALAPLVLGPLASAALFVASCAPVLFFVVTGLGYGVSGGRRGPLTASALAKLAILVVADQLLFWRMGRVTGLEFLGFIALSSLVLEGVARAPRPVLLASVSAGAVILLRYGLGSTRALDALGLADAFWPRVALGASGLESVGYPPLPWLVYPLLGFVAGAGLREQARRVTVTAIGVGAVGALAGGLALRAGAPLFRWGTVSIAFFALSFGVLAASVALALAVTRVPPLARGLALRGVSSLALVPLHYAWIALAFAAGLVPRTAGELGLAIAALAALSFASARAFAAAVEGRAAGRALRLGLAGTVPAAALFLLGGAARDRLSATLAMGVAQLGLCWWFALRAPTHSAR